MQEDHKFKASLSFTGTLKGGGKRKKCKSPIMLRMFNFTKPNANQLLLIFNEKIKIKL